MSWSSKVKFYICTYINRCWFKRSSFIFNFDSLQFKSKNSH